MMKFSAQPAGRGSRIWVSWVLAALVLITGGLATWVVAGYFADSQRAAQRAALEQQVRAAEARATGYLALTTGTLEALVGSLRAGLAPDSPIFRRHAQDLLRSQPALMAVGYVDHQPPAMPVPVPVPVAAAGEGEAATESTRPPPPEPAPAGVRADAPLTVLVANTQGPGAGLGSAEALVGTDLQALPALAAAMAKSELTPALAYAGLGEGQWAVLYPVGEQGALRGHLLALLAPQILLQNAVQGDPAEGLGRQLVDPTGTSGGPRLLYEEAPGAPAAGADASRLAGQVELAAFAQRWQLQLVARAGFMETHRNDLPLYAQIGGGALTLVLAGFVFLVSARSARIQQLVHRRTAELSEAYQRLRDSEMMAMQSEKMSSLGQMVAGVAHEINTPLGFISSNVQLLRELLGRLRPLLEHQTRLLSAVPHWTKLSPEQRQLWFKAALQQNAALVQIRQEGLSADLDSLTAESLSGLERLTDLVLTLKNFSRLDRAMVDEVDLNGCIEDTLKIAHNVIKQKADVEKSLSPLPKIRCNPSQINQVLLNLITNAAHAIQRYGTVSLKSWVEQQEIRISVRDNGKGMTPDVLARIFEPFFTTKGQGEGTGLGLAISQRIIEEHGGRLEVQSEAGVGTVFTIHLPIHR